MGACTWTYEDGSVCFCKAGACISQTGMIEGVCRHCGHLMSMHTDYGNSAPSFICLVMLIEH
jgi:hypothetical protein